MKVSKSDKLNLYRKMVLIRRTEEKLRDLFAQGAIPGFIHLSIGQEGVAAGVCSNLTAEDVIASTHRGHGHAIAKGIDLKRFMAEIFGRATGCCEGRGGSMHMADRETGILGSNGIVGAGLPIATGAAFACRYRGTDRVVAAFFGEGATGTGAFHEALNLASLWELPILYCCETNGWAEFTPTSIHVKTTDVVMRASAYGMEGRIVNGDDVMEVYQAAAESIGKIRKNGGPIFLEFKTHRWEGHFAGDPQKYRFKEDVAEARRHCPIERLKADLLNGASKNGVVEEIEKDVEREIDEAVRYAQNSPLPGPEDLAKHVYA